jgi:hypothetical protein
MTRPARVSKARGIVTPSAFAVFRRHAVGPQLAHGSEIAIHVVQMPELYALEHDTLGLGGSTEATDARGVAGDWSLSR